MENENTGREMTIKWCDGIRVITSHEVKELREGGFPALWKYLNWDIENDKLAKECSQEIVRNLFARGRIDLSGYVNGTSTFILEVISAEESEEN